MFWLNCRWSFFAHATDACGGREVWHHTFSSSMLDGAGWLTLTPSYVRTLHSRRYTLRRIWLDPRNCWGASNNKNFSCACRETNQDFQIVQPVGYSLHWLRYPSSQFRWKFLQKPQCNGKKLHSHNFLH
jgi:hypothetical protein